MRYILMHREKPTAEIEIDELSNITNVYDVFAKEHLNAITLEWEGVAPVFDCGTSLWYNTQENLIKPIFPSISSKPFKKTHNEQIKLVKDFSWRDLDNLNGIESIADEILSQSEYISKARKNVLCNAIKQRVQLLRETAI